MANFKWFKIKAVQEKGERYDVDRKISGPYDIHRIARDVLEMDTEAEEVFMLLTLNTKNQVTGIFEVSRGTINTSLVHPREVFKRALRRQQYVQIRSRRTIRRFNQ
ncbi:MAG: JAB domain-containing protein [Candidatus Alkaliphilus sp. MAG34]